MAGSEVSTAIRLALGSELILVSLEKLVPGFQGVLPLGGDEATQVGMLLALSVGLTEVAAGLSHALKRFLRKITEWRRR